LVLFITYCCDYEKGENEVGRACGTHEKDEKCILIYGLKSLQEKDHFEEKGVDGSIILKCFSGK
jgi:hypothetical protein